MSETIKTLEYDKFKFMEGNRPINWNHVERLKREMLVDPEWFEYEPMLVNENFYILDGQHSYLAAKDVGHPLYYKVRKGATLDSTRRMNTTRRQWTMDDFAHSFATSGRKDYIEFVRLRARHPEINNSILLIILAGGRRNGLGDSFRRGEFKIDNRDEANEHIDRLQKIIDLTHAVINTPMAVALLQLFKADNEFDFDHFLKKLERAKEEFVPSSTVRNCLRSIEDVYNYQSKSRVRLY